MLHRGWDEQTLMPYKLVLFCRRGIYLLVFLPALLCVGVLYQVLAESIDMHHHPPPGRLVDVGGYRLHIYCLGQGTPTVILEAGFMQGVLAWTLVQPKVAQFTRVCAYDRGGVGWSDLGTRPRTPAQIASELHTLLSVSEITGPYVLVGHSIGGIFIRAYTRAYPNEVIGMVLVDARPEESWAWTPRGFVWKDGLHQFDLGAYYRPVLARIGLMRLMGMPSGFVPLLPSSVRDAATAVGLRAVAYDWLLYDGTAVKEAEEDVQALGQLPDIPLLVLSALPPSGVWSGQTRGWQNHLVKLSPQGKQILVDGSGHFINLRRPEIVIDAIRQVVEAARRNLSRSYLETQSGETTKDSRSSGLSAVENAADTSR